jgi:hypothetical protein
MTRLTGASLTAGAVALLVFNPLFPRADDPWDVPAVLAMMAENATLRQSSFLAITVGLLAVTAGLVGIQRSMGIVWARLGLYAVLVGVTLFATAAGLGMAATGAAVGWVDAGSDVESVEYAIAAALNLADDHVWFWSIITYWTGLGLLGAAIASHTTFPRWLGLPLAVIGFATAAFVGVPLALGVEAPALFLVFGVCGGLTTLWVLAAGIWILRHPTAIDA